MSKSIGNKVWDIIHNIRISTATLLPTKLALKG